MAVETTPSAMGQWANAPLVFVLAQVRFASQADGFTDRMQQLVSQSATGNFQPGSPSPIMEVQFEIGPGGSQNQLLKQLGMAYNVVRGDGRMLVRIEPNAISMAANIYQSSKQFREEWLPLVASLEQAGLVGPINRLGLRYVDFVIPKSGLTPEDYVRAPWNQATLPVLPGSVGLPGLHVSVHDVEFQKGRMRLQYMRGFGSPSLPADLAGLLEPLRRYETIDPTAVIDSDRWMEGEWIPSGQEVIDDFSQMHRDVSAVFKAMISDRAMQEWTAPSTKGVSE